MSVYAILNNGTTGLCINIVEASATVAAQLGFVGPLNSINPQPGIGWSFNGSVWSPPTINIIDQNTQQIQINLSNHLTTIESFIAANPSGAVLTAAQTLFVAQTLAGLIRITLGLVGTIGQAN